VISDILAGTLGALLPWPSSLLAKVMLKSNRTPKKIKHFVFIEIPPLNL